MPLHPSALCFFVHFLHIDALWFQSNRKLKLLSEDNRELELKENIDEGIDFNSIKDDPKMDEELAIVDEDELADGYSEESELLDEEDSLDDEDLLLDDEDLLDIDEFDDNEE